MSNARQYAVLQKDLSSPTAEQLKRAFRSFSTLTDADAVRLAVGAHGILLRHENRDAARAFQTALQAEGVATALVAEDELPGLPEARVLHRLELSPEALKVFDLLGRPTTVPWPEVTLLAAGAVGDVEVSRAQTERTELRFSPVLGVWPKRVTDSRKKVMTDSQMVLEILLAGMKVRYQIEAAHFPFKYVIDQPGLSTADKFIWLVRQFCRYAIAATLNGGVRWLRAGNERVPGYVNRQALTDEILWLLWYRDPRNRAAKA
jgi:hypothetical protein